MAFNGDITVAGRRRRPTSCSSTGGTATVAGDVKTVVVFDGHGRSSRAPRLESVFVTGGSLVDRRRDAP